MNSISVDAKTSTGGEVLKGNDSVKMGFFSASCVGDEATCKSGNKYCKGIGKIMSDSMLAININGKQIAQAGDWVNCGCPTRSNVLIADGVAIYLGLAPAG
ncbi:hypothetical protein GCM10007916_28940 [Psychromonas marina]|uniref:PAAR domain-containing protein n=1 Tax=Psychromonas marina TaxID=88364 RepID=A0ABQ6E3K0_9GAMM|nr:PAAR domain-containing protein [Psychromonas marina]GLS91824.1 hypothetical protein GCM10007916_28940 [Psychromonas marina]